jgi:hypothetical protein
MKTLTPVQKQQADSLVTRIEAKIAVQPQLAAAMWVSPLGTYLKESETLLIQLMSGQQPGENEPGSIEFGLVLYWIDTEYPTLAKILFLPPTAITSTMLGQWDKTLEGAGVVYADGSLVAYSTYAGLDVGWLLAPLTYIGLLTGVITIAPFGTNPATVQVPKGSTVSIALTGDWGSGSWTDGSLTCPSMQVVKQIQSLKPDFTIHLGDVYYAGISSEETSNLLQSWYAGPQGTFTLNSNHEMYDGANGYFQTALAASGAFKGQQGTSYFAIHSDDWVLVGLDSAYGSSDLFYMAGAVTDTNQIQFLQGLNAKGKQIIVLTHHNPLSTDGTMYVDHSGNLISTPSSQCLWNDVTSALGRAPDYWYWGHIHNGIVYSDQSVAGTTQVRCIGHGALPFGSAYELQSDGSPIPSVTYFANTLLSSQFSNTTLQQQNRVLNGFAVLTLGPNGVQEALYDQTGALVWSS